MEIIKVSIDNITPYEKNAKVHTKEQIKQIKKSIKKFGMNDPIAIWGDKNIIVEGHGRYTALKEMGAKEIECIRLDHLSEDERKAYTLAHNKISLNTDIDMSIAQDEIDEIINNIENDIDMTDFGFIDIEEKKPKTTKDLSDEVTEKIELIVECKDEAEQEMLFYRLTEEGYTCRTLIL